MLAFTRLHNHPLGPENRIYRKAITDIYDPCTVTGNRIDQNYTRSSPKNARLLRTEERGIPLTEHSLKDTRNWVRGRYAGPWWGDQVVSNI